MLLTLLRTFCRQRAVTNAIMVGNNGLNGTKFQIFLAQIRLVRDNFHHNVHNPLATLINPTPRQARFNRTQSMRYLGTLQSSTAAKPRS
uniref:Putative secreted protein n=1 Tax=Anopheles darlingi TaxID=43151 RepID=A0A2M4DC38_ANODA